MPNLQEELERERRAMEEAIQLERLRNAGREAFVAGVTGHIYMNPVDVLQPVQEPLGGELDEEELIKSELKKRHLNNQERRHFHKPKSDWRESPAGEICRNAETLIVSDIVNKFIIKK